MQLLDMAIATAEAATGDGEQPDHAWQLLDMGNPLDMSTEERGLRATYRLQLTTHFGFPEARRLVPYLRDLGISHLYLSPSLQAREGSTHGYDVVNPGELSRELGGRAAFEALAAEAHGAGLGIVLDVVPNHMAADDANRYWADPALRERFFDIDPVSGHHRRFFDIDELAAVRQEREEVFSATHELVLALLRDGLLDGLRVDHPDGLADPAGYLRRLRDGGARRVWVEKILDPGERLRDWPVSGTVGYEFLNDACALFVDPAAEEGLSALWERISGDRAGFGEVARTAKLEQARSTFRPELERLARTLVDDAERLGEIVPGGLDALAQALSSLPVYRTYIEPERGRIADEDREAIAVAGMPDEIARRLQLEQEAPAEFVTRFQQTTPAIMAKGVEDTAFYRYLRLLALNDVGGDPGRFGIDVETFHRGCRERQERFPENLLSTQTHDAKRSADVRMRIAALSWIAPEWERAVEEWMALTERHRRAGAPDDAERYLIFQTLAGAWPLEQERLLAYVEKALREAKRNTNWITPDADWERAARDFCAALYDDDAFQASLARFVARLAPLGRRAALGQLALKLTAPGVPDIYQGDEIEFRALVDPDNRRPVDFALRQALLRRLMGGGPPGEETRKLWVTLRLLGLRARWPDAFAGGEYEPLDAGRAACAFVRGGRVMTVVALPRSGAAAAELRDAPGGRWCDVLHGRTHTFASREQVAALVGELGFAVFERI